MERPERSPRVSSLKSEGTRGTIDSRVLGSLTSTDGPAHPVFVGVLDGKAAAAKEGEEDREEDEAVQGTREDEREPHSEEVDLSREEIRIRYVFVEAGRSETHLEKLGASEGEDGDTDELCHGDAGKYLLVVRRIE